MNHPRRRFLAAGLAALAARAWAAPAAGGEGFKPRVPYEMVGPFPDDAQIAYGFFQYTCPFCRQHMGAIAHWGASLPLPLRFAASPIPQEPAGLQGARAYYAVKRAAPAKLAEFDFAVYAAIHDQRAVPEDERTYLAAARGVGVTDAALRPFWRSDEVKRDVLLAKLRYERYAIDHTPSISIAGRYVLNAELVNGDYPMLLNLANGIISQMLPQFAKGGR